MWESVPDGGPGEGWTELDENGWGALIGWAAGPEKLRQGPAVDDSARTVTLTRTDKNGTVIETIEALTTHDRQIVDGEVKRTWPTPAWRSAREGSVGLSGSPPSSLAGRNYALPSRELSTRANPRWFIRPRSHRS